MEESGEESIESKLQTYCEQLVQVEQALAIANEEDKPQLLQLQSDLEEIVVFLSSQQSTSVTKQPKIVKNASNNSLDMFSDDFGEEVPSSDEESDGLNGESDEDGSGTTELSFVTAQDPESILDDNVLLGKSTSVDSEDNCPADEESYDPFADESQQQREHKQKSTVVATKWANSPPDPNEIGQIGQWEAHTTGFGSRILKALGYQLVSIVQSF